jgi:hypothetical protein
VVAKRQDLAYKIAREAGYGPPIWNGPHMPGQKLQYHPTSGGKRSPNGGHVLY